jgi:hypothetical protein
MLAVGRAATCAGKYHRGASSDLLLRWDGAQIIEDIRRGLRAIGGHFFSFI